MMLLLSHAEGRLLEQVLEVVENASTRDLDALLHHPLPGVQKMASREMAARERRGF